MKKLLFVVAMMSIATNIYADDTFEVNGALYSITGSYLTLKGFANKENVRNYKIPESITYNTRTIAVKQIGYEAFKDCVNLVSLTIPGSIEYMETFYYRYSSQTRYFSNAFENCKSLKKIIFEDSSKPLDIPYYLHEKKKSSYNKEGLFYDCCLEYIYIGRDIAGGGNDYRNQPLSKIEFGPYVTAISGAYGNYNDYQTNKTYKTVTIPQNVKKIKGFSNCLNLEEVIILGNGLIEIGEQAFWECKNLTTINLPKSLVKIDNSAFQNCENLKEIYLSDNVETLGFQAFILCKNLSRVTIGKNVKSIGKNAFMDCSNIKTVISRMDNPNQCSLNYSEPFGSSTYANSVLFVPIGKKELYMNHSYWGKFFNIQESAEATNISINSKKTNNLVLEDDQLKLEGFMPLDKIMLYDADGRLKYKSKISTEGTLSIPLYNYPRGVYFVKTKGNVYKFAK